MVGSAWWKNSWVILAVICQVTIARLMNKSGSVQIQLTASTLGETESDQNNLLYVDIKNNSSSELELWHKVLLQLSNLTTPLGDEKLRRKRYVFGKDNRVRVRTSDEAQTYPFSTVVLLSIGCTGTLVGARHVLTAAHCIHNGSKYLRAPKLLRIGSLKRPEHFQWIRVETVFIPKQWKKSKLLTEQTRLKYDFAVLRLKRKHGRPIMALKPCDLKAGSKMQFAGFHGDKWFKSLWYSQCTVFRKSHGMIFNFCDGSKGVSGSGVYVKTGLKNAVVGIVTAIGRAIVDGKELRFNIVNSLTRNKIRKISKWIAKG